jgi:spermidine synthase
VLVTQASTPFFSPRVLASIQATLAELHLQTRPYGVDVPSFGPWGFVLAYRGGRSPGPAVLPFQGRWIDQGQLDRLFPLSRDLALPPGERVLPNRLQRPVLADYQRQGRWREN